MRQSKFLFENTGSSLNSADIVFEQIWDHFEGFQSFIDLGCGLGGWSASLEARGISEFKCYDHPSVPIEKLLVRNKTNFVPIDLEKSVPDPIKVDFGICIEVLEHFTPESGINLVEFLSECTDFILFSAAIPFQKGVGHINEQRHSYWHNKFAEKGYSYYDGFKPKLYHFEDQIKFYHIQNLFIYYRGKHTQNFANKSNITSTKFEIVAKDILEKPFSFSELLKKIPSSLLRSARFRINKSRKT